MCRSRTGQSGAAHAFQYAMAEFVTIDELSGASIDPGEPALDFRVSRLLGVPIRGAVEARDQTVRRPAPVATAFSAP